MKKELKALFTPQDLAPFARVSNGINTAVIAVCYLIPLLLIFLYPRLNGLIYIISGVLVMGAVQHTLATLVHEAAHFSMFTNRKWNDFFAHHLCAAPLLSYLKDYRYFHFEHHRHTGKVDKDPELKLYHAMGIQTGYEKKSDVIKIFFNDFSGVNYLRSLKYLLEYFKAKRESGVIEKPKPLDHLSLILWITIIPVISWQFNLLIPYLLFWILPLFTVTPILLRWHGFGEHIREKGGCASENTLTHKMNPISTLFLYPINSSFHLEHHLYPQIPWTQLKAFHRWAMLTPQYKLASEKMTVDSLFSGKKTIVETTLLTRQITP